MKGRLTGAMLLLGIVLLVLLTGCGNLSPVASFTRTPSSGEAPLSVSFNASSSYDSDGTIANYEWSFGDGYSGAGETTTHTFNSAGTYSATLTVTDNGGARNSTSHSITVTAAPQVEYRVTAEQLYSEFDTNAVAGDLKYKGKLIAVTGYVDEIDSTFGISVVLVGSPGGWFGVRGYFPESEAAAVAQLREGDYATIVGECTGMLMFNVGLEDCYVE